MIYLHNTLTNKKEEFKSITPGVVKMYNCGPTVYDFAHIGNLRAYVFADTLRRMFEVNGYDVKQVINLTDVGHPVADSDDGEDKMLKGARREAKSVWDIADFYTQAYFANLDELNIPREKITFPKATDYINEQIAMIEVLEKKGFTYAIGDGIYFDTHKFPAYGKLGNINLEGLEEGARIGVNDDKRNLTDFALWKFSPTGEGVQKREMEWLSPWGVGFPGWHIECSAMARALLGDTIDIHTGGVDHIPVHHNNEIAQSESCNECRFANYWLHFAFVIENNKKMAKSDGDFLTLQVLVSNSIAPLAYRYWLLTSHYRTQTNFSFEAVKGAEQAMKRLVSFLVKIRNTNIAVNQSYKDKFLSFINDDLDTPKALALIWELVKDSGVSDEEKYATILYFDNVLGLNLEKQIEDEVENKKKEENKEIPEEIQKLIEERKVARENKDWAKADELRGLLQEKGFEIKD